MKILITGSSGFIGGHLMRTLAPIHNAIGLYNANAPQAAAAHFIKADITDFKSVAQIIQSEKPEAIIHTAAISSAVDSERDPEKAHLVNVDATKNLAEAAGKTGAYMIFFSTDMVFDGENAPYRETDLPKPISVYGRTKVAAEKLIPESGLVLRISLCYGKSLNEHRATFIESAIKKIVAGEKVTMFDDEWRTPVWAGDLARMMPMLLEKKPTRIMHFGGPERMSRYEMGIRICKTLALDPDLVVPASREQAGNPHRQKDVSLENVRLREIYPNIGFTNFEKSVTISFG